MKPLTYTFRTNRHIKELGLIFGSVFVFNDLKNSSDQFIQLIDSHPNHIILGIGNTHNNSRVETVVVNKFGKEKLSSQGPETISLFAPPIIVSTFPTSIATTSTFCNWTMYKINRFANDDEHGSRVSFFAP
jgi:hypothetical protein